MTSAFIQCCTAERSHHQMPNLKLSSRRVLVDSKHEWTYLRVPEAFITLMRLGLHGNEGEETSSHAVRMSMEL